VGKRPYRAKVSNEPETLINQAIRASEVRVIADDGEQIGILPIAEAIDLAAGRGLDLVEVGGNSRPPVTKIMDYGRYKYLKKKRQAEAKKKQTVIQVKEVKFRPKTESHDLETKLAAIQKFLEGGDKVKVTMRFRGREIMYREMAMAKLLAVAKRLEETAVIEAPPKMEGRIMFMVIAPQKKK
jgi:translation initiation factor IF-3